MLWYLKHILVRRGPQIWLLLKSLYRSISVALAANPFLKQFMRRHPRLIVFVSERLDRKRFSGLPLSLLVMTLVYIAILFGGIVEDFLTSDPIVAVDHAVAQLMARFRPPELIPVFTWVTVPGISRIAGPLLLIALLGAWLARGRWLAISLLASAGGTAVFTLMGKLAFQRPRPMEAVLLEQSYSFPSGHASIAVGLYGFLGYVLIRSAADLRARTNYLLLTLLVILSIGLSRIVLGVHYLSDVWAGYLVGAGWLVIGIAISEWATANRRIDWTHTIPRSQRRLLWLLLFVGLAGYLGYAAQWHPKTFTPPAVATRSVEKPLADLIREENLSHTETLLGTPSQPLSAAFVIPNDSALVALLDKAGWQPADTPSPRNLLKLLRLGMAYQNPPLAPVFWNKKINDLGFARAAEVDGEKIIDTLRLWKTLWRVDGAPVYVGVVRSYTDTYWSVLHRIAPDTDAATQRMLHSLGTTKHGLHSCEVRLGKAEIGNYLLGIPFFSAGKLALVDLRGQTSSGICTRRGISNEEPGSDDTCQKCIFRDPTCVARRMQLSHPSRNGVGGRHFFPVVGVIALLVGPCHPHDTLNTRC